MPWPSDGAVEKASTAGPNNAAGIFLPITDYRVRWVHGVARKAKEPRLVRCHGRGAKRAAEVAKVPATPHVSHAHSKNRVAA